MDVITYTIHNIIKADVVEDAADLESQYEEEQEEMESDENNALCSDEAVAVTENDEKCPFRRSLFAHVPPYIAFQLYDGSEGIHVPRELSKHLNWQLSAITPQLVRRTLMNSGYRLVKKPQEWCGVWGKHMKSAMFKNLKESQKINHFPGTFQIGRKDRLWRNLSRMMMKHGKKIFGFIPRTYVLPQDLRNFRQVWEKTGGKEKWIVKPPASARGKGIRVVHRWGQIPKKRAVIVQQYLSKPKLIDGVKFDLRLYVLVTSFNPLTIYMYPDGLVRFASVKYSDDINYLSDRFMHLTNYSINKTSATYMINDNVDSCNGHKWTIKTLWNYLERDNVNVAKIWAMMKDMVIKTMIAGEAPITGMTRNNTTSRYTCYELFGVDILLDENLKPWLLEINISPSLQSSSPLDVAVKGPLVRNVFNIAGYHAPADLSPKEAESLCKRYNVESVLQDTCLYRTSLSHSEKKKQALYADVRNREDYVGVILEDLTPDDVRHLVSYEDELTRLDKFEKVFPTATSHEYLQYFDVPRYYNMLFDAWEDKYAMNREDGVARLQKLCEAKYHLEQTSDAV